MPADPLAPPPGDAADPWNPPPPASRREPLTLSEAEFRQRTRRSFLVGGVGALAGVLGWRWLRGAEPADRIPWPLRRGHEANERLWRSLYREDALAPEFPVSAARMPRTNGNLGLRGAFDPAAWSLRVEGPDGGLLGTLSLADVRRLPRVDMVTELKCIEGWSETVHWTGARFSDLAALFAEHVPDAAFRYVGLATPDGEYTVGLDRAAALHPQTLLCYAMQGALLTAAHGAPLRLATPLKYGVKSLKRIGTIRFATDRPPDYWAARGYDWYIGH